MAKYICNQSEKKKKKALGKTGQLKISLKMIKIHMQINWEEKLNVLYSGWSENYFSLHVAKLVRVS